MGRLALKYSVFIVSVGLAFANFVACGAQFYKVSVADDIDTSRVHSAALSPDDAEYGIHAPQGWTDLPIRFRVGENLTESQVKGLVRAMKTWEWAVGKKLFEFSGYHNGTNGDTFKDLYSSLKDSVHGHYMDFDWEKTNKKSQVLATTIWANDETGSAITTADIRFNGSYYSIGDSLVERGEKGKDQVDAESLALHELGHYLGLTHTSQEVDPNSVMNPHLFIGEGLTSRKISRGDIERIQQIYGCEGDACDIDSMYEAYEQEGLF